MTNTHSFLSKGALAQLVERLHGMQEVSGSTPLCSTRKCFLPNLLRHDANNSKSAKKLITAHLCAT